MKKETLISGAEVEIHETSTIEQTLLDQWLDFVENVFGRNRNYFKNHCVNDIPGSENHKGGVLFIRRENDTKKKIVASVHLFFREMNFYSQGSSFKVKIACVGDVATLNEYRGKGIASELLSFALEYAKQEGFKLAFLHSRRAREFYQTKGWSSVPVNRSKIILPVQSFNSLFSQTLSLNFQIEPIDFTSETLLKDLETLHENYISNLNGPFSRPLCYWKRWMKSESTSENSLNPVSFVLTSDNSSPIAYIIVNTPIIHSDTNMIEIQIKEYCNSEKSDGIFCFQTLLSFVWNFFKPNLQNSENFHSSTIFLRIHLLEDISPIFDGKCTKEKLIDEGYMYYFLNPFEIGEGHQITTQSQLLNFLSQNPDKHCFFESDAF